MPVIDISRKDLCALVGKPLKDVADLLLYAKGELDAVQGDALKVDIKDTNRPDLWSAEGIAREIAGRQGRPGLPLYPATPSGVVVAVDKSVLAVRPRTVAAVVRNVRMTAPALAQLIQLQEKIAFSFGRGRREVALGVYDLDRIVPPIRYHAVSPEGVRFIPLDGTKEMTPREILAQHPKGKEYGHLLEGAKAYPLFTDARGNVLSLPPIINSAYAGKVTAATRSLFIECSGFELRFLLPALAAVATALAERGGDLQTVEVRSPQGTMVTPDLAPRELRIPLAAIQQLAGFPLAPREVVSLLRQARYEAAVQGKDVLVRAPCYRQDLMHWRNVAEDALISYGFNRMPATPPRLATRGGMAPEERAQDALAEVLVGLGLQEVMSYILTNKDHLFARMQLPAGEACELEHPVSATWSVLRTSVLPSLLEFLTRNKHVDYPQRIFEIGECVLPDPRAETRSRTVRKAAVAVAGPGAGYQDGASLLAALCRAFALPLALAPTTHPSFLPGRVAEARIGGKPAGLAGELHPQVLNNWGMEQPVAAFEIELAAVLSGQ